MKKFRLNTVNMPLLTDVVVHTEKFISVSCYVTMNMMVLTIYFGFMFHHNEYDGSYNF